MAIIRLFSALLIVALIGFLLKDRLPDLSTEIGHIISQADISTLASSTAALEQKIEVNLPAPLQIKDSLNADNTQEDTSGIITLTNEERKNNGNLPALTENTKLDAEAKAKALDMFAKQYFEHISPDGKGPSDLAETYGYQYITIGENLALGNFGTNQDLLNAWMNSPGHRANILNNQFTEMGAAAEEGTYNGEKIWMAVQEFGRPLSDCSFPDQTLEAKIETLKDDVDQKDQTLESEKAAIDSANPRSGNAYSAQVSQYNNLVVVYNSEVNQLKANITLYNSQVNIFNSCIAS